MLRAKDVCTQKEYEAWFLAHRGMSQRTIAKSLQISRSAVRARLEEATRKVSA